MVAGNIPLHIFPQKKPHSLNLAIKKGLINPTFLLTRPRKPPKDIRFM